MNTPRTLSLGIALVPTIAFAHTGHPESAGTLAGFVHPLSGLDHLLAMLAVGIWAAQAGGRAMWAVPLTFVAAMAAGGIAAASGAVVPGIELGIVGSVIAFGALATLARRLPLPAGLALTGAFAVFHGQAHVAEMGAGGSPVLFGAGFLLATAVLHAAGVGLGQIGRLPGGDRAIRAAGAGIGIVGAAMMAGLA